MSDDRCGIYYSSGDISDIDTIANFLQQQGVSLQDPKTQKILALDRKGDRYETNLAQIKQNLLARKRENVEVWLKPQSDSIWTIRLEDNCWIHEFTFYYLLHDEEVDQLSHIAFKLFADDILSKPRLGMYIDRYGRTYEYDFEPFFVKNEGRIECFTDLICVPEEKLNRVDIDSVVDTVRWLDNGMVCASNDETFLEELLS